MAKEAEKLKKKEAAKLKKAAEKLKEAEAAKESSKVRVKAKGINALLNSDKVGDKLAGVVRIMGRIEIARNNKLKENTVNNKTSEAGLVLRKTSDEDLKANKETLKATQIIAKNFPLIKDCLNDPSVKFTDELKEVYNHLLSYGKSDKKGLPDTLTF